MSRQFTAGRRSTAAAKLDPTKLEPLKWGTQTYSVPAKQTSFDSINDKFTYFNNTINGISRGPGNAQNKVQAVVSRFDLGPTAQNDAEEILRPLYNPGAPAINVLGDPNIFTFSDPQIHSRNATPLAWGAANAADIPANTRANGRYLAFTMQVNVAHVHPTTTVPNQQHNVFVQLPLDGNFAINPVYTRNILLNPRLVMMNMAAANNNSPPAIGVLRRMQGAVMAEFNTNQFEEAFKNTYYEAQLHVITERLRTNFLGNATPASTQSAVTNCKQCFWDPSTNGFKERTVMEFYEDFMAKVRTLPQDQPYPIDIAALFYNNLAPRIKQLLEAAEYTVPPRPPVDTNVNASNRVIEIRGEATQHEAQLKVIKSTVRQSAGQRRSGPGMYHAYPEFASHPSPEEHAELMNEIGPPIGFGEYPVMTSVDDCHGGVVSPTKSAPAVDPVLLQELTNAVLLIQTGDPTQLAQGALVLSSVAEEAIRNANAPIRTCWGCGSDKHFWRKCPFRHEPEYQKKAREELQSLTRHRNPSASDTFRDRRKQLQTTWKAEGFQSEGTAALICQIIDPETSPTVRTSCFTSLTSKSDRNSNNNGGGKRQGGTGVHFSLPPDPKKPALLFPCIPTLPSERIAAYQAIVRRSEHQIQMSQVLPHVNWPIGMVGDTNKPSGSLCSLLDTGAGLNVGRLDYHKSIFESHPHLVAHFAYLKDCEGLAPFGLGGVVKADDSEASNDIEALITYKTPFAVNQRPVHVTFGLGKNVACNTILSWPFIQAMQGSILIDSMTFTAGRIGETFSIENKVPMRANVAPRIADSTPPAFPTRPSRFHTPGIAESLRNFQAEVVEQLAQVSIQEDVRVTHPDANAEASS